MTVELLPRSRLSDLEAVIERGKRSFLEVGTALMEIRESRLYRETHKNFDDYCRERWGWGRDYVDKQIAAAKFAEALPTTVGKPKTEREARRRMVDNEPEELQRPQPSEVVELVGHVEDLERLRLKVKAKKVAARLHIRSRAAFARRLRLVGTYLGSIALSIEEGEK